VGQIPPVRNRESLDLNDTQKAITTFNFNLDHDMDRKEEQDIIAQVCRGNRAAFTALVDAYGKPIYNLALRMTSRPADAEDLAQETFLRAFKQLHRFDPNRSFYTWLYTISLNLIRSHLKKVGRQQRSAFSQKQTAVIFDDTSDELIFSPDPEDGHKERLEGLDQQLQSLSTDLREILVLRFYQELSFDAIAEITGRSESAVKMRVYRGLEKLRIRLTNSES
jgi:RNA polymerase sigma-70 factor, ECF subfamily